MRVSTVCELRIIYIMLNYSMGATHVSHLSHLSKLFFPVTGRIIRVTELPNEISVLGHGDTNSKSVGDQIK